MPGLAAEGRAAALSNEQSGRRRMRGEAVAVTPRAQSVEGRASGEHICVGVTAADELRAYGQVALRRACRIEAAGMPIKKLASQA
jgi:hypothetical protein